MFKLVQITLHTASTFRCQFKFVVDASISVRHDTRIFRGDAVGRFYFQRKTIFRYFSRIIRHSITIFVPHDCRLGITAGFTNEYSRHLFCVLYYFFHFIEVRKEWLWKQDKKAQSKGKNLMKARRFAPIISTPLLKPWYRVSQKKVPSIEIRPIVVNSEPA